MIKTFLKYSSKRKPAKKITLDVKNKTDDEIRKIIDDFTITLRSDIKMLIKILSRVDENFVSSCFGYPDVFIGTNGDTVQRIPLNVKLEDIQHSQEIGDTGTVVRINKGKILQFLIKKDTWLENNPGDIFFWNVAMHLDDAAPENIMIYRLLFISMIQSLQAKNIEMKRNLQVDIIKSFLGNLEKSENDLIESESTRAIFTLPNLSVYSDNATMFVTPRIEKFFNLSNWQDIRVTWDKLSTFDNSSTDKWWYFDQMLDMVDDKVKVEAKDTLNKIKKIRDEDN